MAGDERCDRGRIGTLIGQENASLVPVEDPGGPHVDVGEPGGDEPGAILGLFHGSGKTRGPQRHAVAQLGGNRPPHDDVGDRQPTSRPQDSEYFAEHPILVDRQVDDAVGDDDINGLVGERDALDLPLEELHVRGPGLASVASGQLQHLIGHVQPVDMAAQAHPLSAEKYISTPTRPQVQDGFALV